MPTHRHHKRGGHIHHHNKVIRHGRINHHRGLHHGGIHHGRAHHGGIHHGRTHHGGIHGIHHGGIHGIHHGGIHHGGIHHGGIHHGGIHHGGIHRRAANTGIRHHTTHSGQDCSTGETDWRKCCDVCLRIPAIVSSVPLDILLI